MAEYIKATPETLLWLEQDVLPKALNGDYEQVKMLLRVMSHAIEQGIPLPEKLAFFLTLALRNISQGEDPGKAFCIKRKRGERDTSAATEQAVLRVFEMKLILRDNPGMSVESARGIVSDAKNIPDETLKAAWRDYKDCVELKESGAIVFFRKTK